MPHNPTHQDLLARLYDAVLAPAGFQAFIERLSGRFDLKAVTLISRNVQTQELRGLWLCGLTKPWLESYSLDYAGEDILAQHIMASPVGHFYASNLDVPHPERFAETRFFREWVVPQGVACAAGAIVLQDGPWMTQMILQRGLQHPLFGRRDLEELDLLVPHLQRAIQMRQRLAELQLGQSFLAGGLDVLAMPTFLFDEHGRVAHHNRSAAELLQASRHLRLEAGNLAAPDVPTTRRLSVEIGQAIRASRGDGVPANSVVLLPRPRQLPLMLMVSPLQRTDAAASASTTAGAGAALLFAFDPEVTPRLTIDLVRRLFLLSQAEAELSIGLCCGKSLEDIATERGTSINTVKSQLKSAFTRTGTKRQSELISLLLASPAYFLAQEARTP